MGGLHDIKAVFPLRTATDKLDGGSGAAKMYILDIKNYVYRAEGEFSIVLSAILCMFFFHYFFLS